MKRILFAFLFLFVCVLTGCTEKLNAEDEVLAIVSEEIADLEELESRIEELCEGEGPVYEETQKVIDACETELEEAVANAEEIYEELEQSWARLPISVRRTLFDRLVEDPSLRLASVSDLRPNEISLSEFSKMVNDGKKYVPIINESSMAQAKYAVANGIKDTIVETEFAKLEMEVEKKRTAIFLKLMEDCPGFNEIDAEFPLDELISPIVALTEKFGWNENVIEKEAVNIWKFSRPCLHKCVVVAGIEYNFRWIPAGSFTMGSPVDEPGRDDDETQHAVTLTKGFWMLETEVTQEMWQSVMGKTIEDQARKFL